jgi:peptidoglycan/LPS O-acetylase OafA/YrhL
MLGAIAYNTIYSKISFVSNPGFYKNAGKWLLALSVGLIFLFPHIDANYQLKKGLFYLFIAFAIPFIFNLTKDNRFDKFIGELSYPVYLIWGLRVDVTKYICDFFHITSENVKGIIFYTFILLASIAIHLFIEKPVEKIRTRFRKKNLAPI